jgi:hypothetical protein
MDLSPGREGNSSQCTAVKITIPVLDRRLGRRAALCRPIARLLFWRDKHSVFSHRMRKMDRSGCLLAFLAVMLLSLNTDRLSAQAEAAGLDSELATAEGVVTELYGLVTFPAGTTPDWDRVRSLFLDEAVVILRTTRTESTVFSVEGFVQDFVNFIERANVEQTGFSEKITKMKSMVFRDLAHVLVLYEAHIPGSPRAPTIGVDSFQLVKRDGRWWIVSVTNDLPNAEHPIPVELRN